MGPDTDKPLNATAASLLGFLQASELTGYELVAVAERSIGPFWSLTRSQVYRELAALAERGLVQEGEPGPRARRPYRLTAKGRAAFTVWMETTPAAEAIRYPLLLTMSFGSFVEPEVLGAHLETHRRIHEQRLADYEAVPGDVLDRFGRVVLSFGLHYEQAVLAWMTEVTGILAETGDRPPGKPPPA
jgi:DNA-binding PadR family transcriptional regulator